MQQDYLEELFMKIKNQVVVQKNLTLQNCLVEVYMEILYFLVMNMKEEQWNHFVFHYIQYFWLLEILQFTI